jgi:hypothetical protein
MPFPFTGTLFSAGFRSPEFRSVKAAAAVKIAAPNELMCQKQTVWFYEECWKAGKEAIRI